MPRQNFDNPAPSKSELSPKRLQEFNSLSLRFSAIDSTDSGFIKFSNLWPLGNMAGQPSVTRGFSILQTFKAILVVEKFKSLSDEQVKLIQSAMKIFEKTVVKAPPLRKNGDPDEKKIALAFTQIEKKFKLVQKAGESQ